MSSLRGRTVLLGFCAVAALSVVYARADMPSGNMGGMQRTALLQHPETHVQPEAVMQNSSPLAARQKTSASSADIVVPQLPDVEVKLPETEKQAGAASPATGDIVVPALPEIEPSLSDGSDRVIATESRPTTEIKAQAPSIDTLPLPPQAEIVLTDADRLGSALAAQLADHGNGKGLRLNPRLPKDVRQTIADFYESKSFQPVWIDKGEWSPAASSVRDQLARAADDALDPADYPVPVLNDKKDPEALAQAELALTASAILYARDARGGRLNPSRLSKNITPVLELPGAADVLAALSVSRDAGKTLESYNPQHPGYAALKKKLTEVRQSIPSHTLQEVPRGQTLKVGMRDERVPLIRARFGLGPAEREENTYDAVVAAAIANFQKERGLKASGDLNNQTVLALGQTSDNPRRLENDIIANMERWRWLPQDLGERYIQVNVPEYELRVVAEGAVVSQTRVIVGKAQSPTPIFSGAMQTVVVNPSWTIPPSIMKNEILPGLARDPDYAAKRGYQVTRARNGNLTVRQPPGERNALGFIKFLFPNQHAVYLHDTPNRSLFSAQKRAFSHGCVRVEQPFQFAEQVLGSDNWPSQKMRGMIGKGERSIKLETPLPVHMTYFTLSVDDHGEVRRFDDIYGFNRQVRDALGLKG